jgi:hypothetical protein
MQSEQVLFFKNCPGIQLHVSPLKKVLRKVHPPKTQTELTSANPGLQRAQAVAFEAEHFKQFKAEQTGKATQAFAIKSKPKEQVVQTPRPLQSMQLGVDSLHFLQVPADR